MTRPLHIRQSMIAGVILTVVLTVLNVVQSPGNRPTAAVLTLGYCAVMLALVFLVLRAVESRRH